ncbi:8 kDa protein [Cactus virus X]|uniref:8 kDa protein n=1 Tax=Cactus virus X TaxID=112227 RepID=Q91ND7_9VIRU|nr:8 kDa protein [Cactus virus X]AAK69585.1 8 kDa protein [Cactus virus X]
MPHTATGRTWRTCSESTQRLRDAPTSPWTPPFFPAGICSSHPCSRNKHTGSWDTRFQPTPGVKESRRMRSKY